MSQFIIMAAIILYLAVMLGVGVICSRKNNNVDDFYLGGRKLGPFVTAMSAADDDTILKAFLRAKLPDRLVEDFFAFFDVVKSPIAIRSSSLLEDSHYQPFAGIYSTYMIPYLDDKYEMLRMLSFLHAGMEVLSWKRKNILLR